MCSRFHLTTVLFWTTLLAAFLAWGWWAALCVFIAGIVIIGSTSQDEEPAQVTQSYERRAARRQTPRRQRKRFPIFAVGNIPLAPE